MRKWTSPWVLAVAALAHPGCGARAPRGPTVALVTHDEAGREGSLDGEIRTAEAALPVVLERRTLPERASTTPTLETDFGAVRTAYDDGDLEGCLAGLPDDEALRDALASGLRDEVGRALFWRMACLRALGRVDEAETVAREHAARGLPIPADVGAANAVAETMLRDAHRAASASAPVLVTITSAPVGALVSVDGATTEWTTPAEVPLVPGPHLVVLRLPTYAPEVRALEAASQVTTPVQAELSLLEPAPAASALHDALETGAALDADVSLALLATALRTRSLLLVSRDSDRTRAALFGTADAEGARAIVRGERVGDHESDVEGLLRDVLVRARLIAPPTPFYELPELWISVAAAIALGVGVTLGVTLQPEPVTRVVLP